MKTLSKFLRHSVGGNELSLTVLICLLLNKTNFNNSNLFYSPLLHVLYSFSSIIYHGSIIVIFFFLLLFNQKAELNLWKLPKTHLYFLPPFILCFPTGKRRWLMQKQAPRWWNFNRQYLWWKWCQIRCINLQFQTFKIQRCSKVIFARVK